MLCKCHWIVLYIVHFTAFCLGGRFFPDTVYMAIVAMSRHKEHSENMIFLCDFDEQGDHA